MFGAIVGYGLCGVSVIETVLCLINTGSDYEGLSKEKKNTKILFLLVGVPVIINTLFTILAFMMMIKIPSFTWWMALIFAAISISYFDYKKSFLSFGMTGGAFILLWVKVPEAVLGMALTCLITCEVLKWLVSKMLKPKEEKSSEAVPANDTEKK